PKRKANERRRLQQGKPIERPDRAAHADDIDEGQRATQREDRGRSPARRAERSPEGCRIDGENVGVGGERGHAGDIIEPARLERDERPEGGGISDGPAREREERRKPRNRQRHQQYEQPEDREEPGTEGAELGVKDPGEREDARADDSVEAQESGAGKADVALQPRLATLVHPHPPTRTDWKSG